MAVRIDAGGAALAAEERPGSGLAIVGLHGLTATRRYVLMGSRALERTGHRVVLYDARGHGASSPARDGYGYERLAADLLAVLDVLEIERALLVGASMGAHTLLRVALEQPQRVAALVAITPAFDGSLGDPAPWDALARGLRERGSDGFLAAYRLPPRDPATAAKAIRQRLGAHEHPGAVADALEQVPRSIPFGNLDALRQIDVPALVIGTRDDIDPGHPLDVARTYAEALPRARLIVEEPGAAPVAWQGGAISRAVAELAALV